MNINTWEIFSVIFKFGSYLGVASLLGLALLILITKETANLFNRRTLTLILIGLASTICYFFIQVGAFAQTGFFGIFNIEIGALLYNTGNGSLLLSRSFSLGLAILIFSIRPKGNNSNIKFYLTITLLGLAVLFAAYSFTTVGHVSNLGWGWQLILSFHILFALSWIGSLIPLTYSINKLTQVKRDRLLKVYSILGFVIVTGLILAGSLLVIKLLIMPEQEVNLEYLLALISKLTLVGLMLGFAAYHKYVLTPELEKNQGGSSSIIRSIKHENIIGYLVLLVTAILTTTVGISH